MSRTPLSGSSDLPDLTAAILARTSGPACDRLRGLACDFVDEILPAGDRELVSRHWEHCPRCQGLVAGLAATRNLLSGFAQVDPGAAFTASVLARTRSPLLPLLPPADRFLAGWANLMRRPRAALEAAYLVTAAGLILSQLPLPGSASPAGSAFVGMVRTEGRASVARVVFHGQGLTRRALDSSRNRILHPGTSAWTSFGTSYGTRFNQRLERSWRRLVKVAHTTWIWLWCPRTTPAPPSTEPPKAPPRSAL